MKHSSTLATDLGLLALRVTTGGLMAGHGAQKLFGSFGGNGLKGTAGWLESINLKPGKVWALMAGGSEFGSGVLMALGLLQPIASVSMFGPMITAWAKIHPGKPIWATSGGAELPLINMAVATALGLAGPGRFSLDNALDIEVPAPLVALTAVGVAGGIAASYLLAKSNTSESSQEPESDALADEQDRSASAAVDGNMDDGIGDYIDSTDRLQAAEVGADPPGAFGLDLRGGVGGARPAEDQDSTASGNQ